MSPLSPDAPIAIIGLGCRFPGGAHDPDAYLSFLERGGDGVTPLPTSRWDAERFVGEGPGRTPVTEGGFLQQDIFEFDPGFFGISPREAASLDPQQRLLLEVTWEAFVDGGLPAAALAGSATGVFIGGFTLDSMLARFSSEARDAIDNHVATSSSMTLLSNRLSYVFDLRGPSMTVDTACSSSLVALHLACESLRRGECQQAVAGGVNVMLLPSYQVVMSKGRFLAPDGRSKTFEADADGYGRGEGAGVVLLKPLAQAIADGDRVHAVVRGTGVNQDGATDGVPMPNPEAQRQLIAETCARAGVEPHQIGYVEAHGTGTRAGDPVETRAIGQVYGVGRERPLPVGSVKANFGHLEAAAGIAGLIKVALSLREGRILPHRPLRRPNPDIPFHQLRLRVPQQVEAWPQPGPRVAAVNSFGYGGTNAHAILEAPPRTPPARSRPWGGALPLSAKSQRGLSDLATATSGALSRSPLGDLAAAMAHRGPSGEARAVVVGGAEQVEEALLALAEGRRHPALVGDAPAVDGGLCWVFTGMGPQWWGMGRQLYAEQPAFAAALDEADALFVAIGGRSVLAELLADEADSRMARNDVAQPCNLLIQVGLVTLLRAWGPRPDAILGHSVGEVAAAWAAGCLTLEEAVTVAVHRSRLQQRAAGAGGMLAVGVGREGVAPLMVGAEGVVLAADNSPELVTLAGPHEALAEVQRRAEAGGFFAKGVRVEVPYHSPAMDPLREALLASLSGLRPRPPELPLYSTMSGGLVDGAVHDAAYWWRNTRQAVLLRGATEAAAADGLRIYLEVGPHPVLGTSIQGCLEGLGARATTLHCLRRLQPEGASLRRALAELWVRGLPLRWDALSPMGAWVELPRPIWRRERHWVEPEGLASARTGRPGAHPLLRDREDGPRAAWTTRLEGPSLDFLREHVVDGVAVMPGAATVEAALAAARELGWVEIVEDLRFERALVLQEGAGVDLRVELDDAGALSVFGRATRGGEREAWSRHAQGRVPRDARFRDPDDIDLIALRSRCASWESVGVPGFYEGLASQGLAYGPAFRGVRRLWRQGAQVLAELTLSGSDAGWTLHPGLLDAAFQCLVAVADPAEGVTVLPVGARRVRSFGPLGGAAWAHGQLVEVAEGAWEGDLQLIDGGGRVLAEVRGLRCEAALAREVGAGWLHANRWVAGTGHDDGVRLQVLGAGPRAEHLRATLAHRLSGAAARAALVLTPDADDPMGEGACGKLLAALQSAPEGLERLLVVTQGGVACSPGEDVSPAAAAAQGFARVLMNERPELGARLLDVSADAELAEAVAAALSAQEGEEFAWRGGALLSRRVVQLRVEDRPASQPARAADGAAMALEVGQPGRLDSLGMRAVPRPAPGPGEVEVEVEAASLNFKDVMKAMGMLSSAALENAYLGWGLGLEAAGRVCRVGPGVTDLRPGDAVFAYQGGALRSHLLVDQRFAVRRPDSLDAVDGACVFVFLTAWYALVHAGRVQAGETVLVHSAAGGVGLAAVQIARHFGAEVIATAGTEEKRAYLRGLGLRHVFDSRTLDFTEDVREATGGRGVDLVLNALSGQALVRSVELLAPGGRFLELGKQDLVADRPLGLRPFNKSISFHAIDLDRMATERPAWFAPAAREVMAAFESGALRPSPRQVYGAHEAAEAFRDLSSGGRIGKVVLQMQGSEVALRPARAAALGGPRPWLVTGGLGGFGLRAALHLAEQGARRLYLASRRGEVSEADRPTLEAIWATGCEATQVALDVTDAEAVTAFVDGLDDLGGVMHAAMVLDDAPIASLTPAALSRAMGAKALGAWHLHRATLRCELDHFVLFGSISAQVGNPGQAAYAAANAALDGLAWRRAALGLPASCVSWGALAEAGVVARDAATRAHLAGLGLTAMRPAQALSRLDAAARSGSPVFTLVDIDWDRWARATPGVGWSRLSELLRSSGEDGADLAAMPPEERAAAARREVLLAVAEVFRADPEAIDPHRSLRDQGLDSILAVELAVDLGARLDLEISAMDLLSGRGVRALGDAVLQRLGLAGLAEAPAAEVTPAAVALVEEPIVEAAEEEDDSDPHTGVEELLERILVTRPYLDLFDLTIAGERVLAAAVPEAVDEEDGNQVAASELGRHLAILGSLACARVWPSRGQHAWPVASATLEVEPGARLPLGEPVVLEARCLAVDAARGRAEAEGVMRDESGRLLGRLRVGYHVLPVPVFRQLFADHALVTDEAGVLRRGERPYRAAPPRPAGSWDGERFIRRLPALTAEACVGHFPGLPALPVSILGRHVQAAVLDGLEASGAGEGLRVARAELRTERFVWVGQALELVAWPAPGAARSWRCEVRTEAQETVAVFTLGLAPRPLLVPVAQGQQRAATAK